MRPPTSGMQARAAATLDGKPVEVGLPLGVEDAPGVGDGLGVGDELAAGGGVGSTGSGMQHLEEWSGLLSRQLRDAAFRFWATEPGNTMDRPINRGKRLTKS